eukprot:CAMPEP_0201560180 /NCGR_PEP_ID=MMETSP0173_2-20130828/78137_1 /ASSEMBLY_ACC=CAM_ASM_000268 /TAXON_ID=218659 /ORGANISM="Vexillifera sp., Strain DIVA3 564/2" /LENGTH=248 /DNA_ID=CAMNT_0047974619 /DNA_START=73 /DNA_END=819 /DNA_ORIENTATION=-
MNFGNRKKCKVCGKTAYPLESMQYGDDYWHKWCFKCETCSKRLTMQTFKGVQGHIYCEGCRPKPQATQTADRHDLNTIKAAPKVDVVNEQVRGGEVAQKGGTITTDSMSLRTAKEAPKIAVVNDQVRGGEVAQKGGTITSDSMSVRTAKEAPKIAVVNDQVRGGEVAQRGGKITSDSMSVRTAKEAPKIARVNDQVRGEMAGQGGKIDSTAMYISNARNAPKADDGAQLGKRLADAGQTSKPNTGQMA